MQQNAGVRSDVTLSGSPGGEQELTHRCGKTHTDGHNIGLDVLHGVIDGHARGDRSTRRVDVQVDITIGVFSSQQEELCADRICVVISHFAAKPNDALFEQALVDRISQSHGRFISARGLNSHSRSPYTLRVRFHS